MKRILITLTILSVFIIELNAQSEIAKTVIVDVAGWKRVARLDGGSGRGYNELTLMTTGGSSTPRVAKISWFKGWSSYGGLNLISVSDNGYWSEARLTYDGVKAYLEINFTTAVPILKVYLNQSAWVGGDILDGTLPNGGDTVILTAKFGRLNYGEDDFYLAYDGKVGIGTSTPDSKLTVAGKVHAQEVKVTVTAGADFVFEDSYQPPSLKELESFIKTNKHLPEIASAKEMESEGLELGAMNIKLLQKIEELTLYTIEQQKEIANLKDYNLKKESEEDDLGLIIKMISELQNRLKKMESKTDVNEH